MSELSKWPLRGASSDHSAECARYAALLPANGFDIALLGIGENGHLAFNDPHVAATLELSEQNLVGKSLLDVLLDHPRHRPGTH